MRAFKRSAVSLAGLVAAVMAAMFIAVGCSDDGNDNPGGGNNNGGGGNNNGGQVGYDSRLIVGEGEAWMGTVEGDECDENEDICFGGQINIAMIIRADGEMMMYTDALLGLWIGVEAEWYTRGNNRLYFVIEGEDGRETDSSSYTVSGNTLRMSDPEDPESIITFTKQPFSGGITPGGELDPALVNTAWMTINLATGNIDVWTFAMEEGVAAAMYIEMSADGEEMENMIAYMCRTENGILHLTVVMDLVGGTVGQQYSYPYSISGDVLTLNGRQYMSAGDIGDILGKNRLSKAQVPNAKPFRLFR